MDLDLAISLNKEDLSAAWDVLKELGFIIRQPIRKEEFTDPERLLSLAKEKDEKAFDFTIF